MLTVTDSNTSFILNEKEAIDLELKLNVTLYGHLWRKKIGDVLYNYGTGNLSDETLVVTHEEFTFLEILRNKESWKVCHNLSL